MQNGWRRAEAHQCTLILAGHEAQMPSKYCHETKGARKQYSHSILYSLDAVGSARAGPQHINVQF